MADEHVRCTGCGRAFEPHAIGPRGRCLYCGGDLEGHAPPQLALVQKGAPPPEEEVPLAERARRGKPGARNVPVLRARGPSRWAQPTSWLQDLAVEAMLLLGTVLGLALAFRDHPFFPPRALFVAALLALPVVHLGGRLLVWAAGLLRDSVRSAPLAIPALAVGLVLGLPGALAQGLGRANRRVFGLWGFLVMLIVSLSGLGWLDAHRDPWRGVQARLAATASPLLNPEASITSTGWAGEVARIEHGAFALRLERVGDEEAWGTVSWVDIQEAVEIHAAWSHNHIAFVHPGVPGTSPWLRRAGVRSVMDLWMLDDGRLKGEDSLSGAPVAAERAWSHLPEVRLDPAAAQRTAQAMEGEAPAVVGPTALRPMIRVEDEEITAGRAFALRLGPEAEPVLVTAASLFSPAGGLRRPLIPQMLPALTEEALFFDLTRGAMRARGRLVRPPSGAHALSRSANAPPDASGDVLAFSLLPGSSIEPLSLREAPVAARQYLWVPARPADPEGGEERLLVSRVITTWEKGFSLHFEPLPVPGDLVGAPLLDSRGQVAGMVVGIDGEGERAQAIAIPAPWIAARLAP
ncbi:MAG: hypothetical protein ABIO70_31305 [Pseudomonadota bacterium]